MVLCAQPGCQTTAGCICDRVSGQELVKRFNEWSPAETGEVVAAADAMRQKRQELISQPLAMVYVQIARAGLDAAARYRAKNVTETIECAAILSGDLMFSIPKPARHHDVLREMDRCGVMDRHRHGSVQGFMTSAGRFVGREEARKIADAADQIIPSGGEGEVPFKRQSSQLFSEDVW